MKKNAKYISPETLHNRLTRIIKGKTIQLGDVIAWCGQVEAEYLGEDYQLITHRKKPFDVESNKKVRVPNNVFRLFSVTNMSGERITYDYNGAYVFLPDSYEADKVLMNYQAIPVDPDTGYPLILRGHEPVCEAYCVKNIYYEDYLNGKIDQNRWNTLTREFENRVAGASTGARYLDASEKEDIIKAMYKVVSPFNYPNSF